MIEWLNKTFSIKNEVSVPTLISIIVFVTGGIIKYLFIKITEYNSRKANRNTYCTLLKEVIKDLKIKEMNVAKFYPQIILTREDPICFHQKTVSYLDIIFEFDFKDIYYSFRKTFLFTSNNKLKDKAFHKTWSILRSLKISEERLLDNLNDFSEKYNNTLGVYYNNLERYREHNENELHKYKISNSPNINQILSVFLRKEEIIFFTWEDLGDIRTHYYSSYINLILPLLKLNRKYYELPITLENGRLLVICELSYKEIESVINSYHSIFKNYHSDYRSYQRILKKCLTIIS